MNTPNKRQINPESSPHHSKCVCQICTCGKHQCPEKHIPFQAQTTHNHDFQPYRIKAESIQKIPYIPTQSKYDPQLIKTTYQQTYVPYQINNNHPYYQRNQYKPNRGKFQDETEYKKSYIPNRIQVQQPIIRNTYIPNSTKFQGTTTYQAEYDQKKVLFSPSQDKKIVYEPKRAKFEGTTTYQNQYKPHQIVTDNNYNNYNQYSPNRTPFQGESRYKQEYRPYKVQNRHVCATEQLPARPRKCSPGKEHLNYNAIQNKWE